MIGQIIIIILASIGFSISYYIHYHKVRDRRLICIVGNKDCSNVVNSEYNKFLGMNNEILGIIYYGFIVLIYSSSFYFHIFQNEYIILVVTAAIGGAAIFAVYLTFVQIFILKDFCEWCLASTVISISIFFLFIS